MNTCNPTAWLNQVKEEIGGYDDLVQHVIQKVIVRYKEPISLLSRSKGLILYGKPGTGKTTLAITIAKTSGLPYYVLNSPDIYQKEEGVTEQTLSDFFAQASNHDASILILDEIDLIAGKWTPRKSELERRISSMLLSSIDALHEKAYIVALTSRLHDIDPAFIRSGRLDDIQELSIRLPAQRYEALEILTKNLPFQSTEARGRTLKDLSQITHGFVPTDLQSLTSQAAFAFIKESSPYITENHFKEALTNVKPSNLNEFTTKIPNITFEDIYGIDSILQEIKTSVIQPFHSPERYIKLGISPPKGILVHGPSGVGKTMLCSALAAETGVNFMLVESTQVRSKIVGESEKAISKLFAQARANAPCILFIDQIDMLLPKRGTSHSSENTSDRIVTGFLTEMDGLLTKKNRNNAQIDVLVVAATSRFEMIDPAVLRPGRFDEHIYIPLPNKTQRKEIIAGISSKMPIELSEQQLNEIVEKTDNWSGAQLDNLFREAAMTSLRENVNNTKITYKHILSCI